MRKRQLVCKDGTILEQDKERESIPDFVLLDVLGEERVFQFDAIMEGDGREEVELYREV